MTTLAEDLIDILVTKGRGTKNVDMFQSHMDDEPDDAVLILEGGGQGAQRTMDFRRILNPSVAIVVRAGKQNFAAGYALAHAIYDDLLDLSNTAINQNAIIGCNPIGSVSDIGRDEKDRNKWSMNFIVKRT